MISTPVANTSTGFGLSIVARTKTMLVQFISGYPSSALVVKIYRSTTGIPASGKAPYAGDVLVVQSTSLTTNDCVLKGIDTGLTQGNTYYYYVVLTVASVSVPAANASYAGLLGSSEKSGSATGNSSGYTISLEALSV